MVNQYGENSIDKTLRIMENMMNAIAHADIHTLPGYQGEWVSKGEVCEHYIRSRNTYYLDFRYVETYFEIVRVGISVFMRVIPNWKEILLEIDGCSERLAITRWDLVSSCMRDFLEVEVMMERNENILKHQRELFGKYPGVCEDMTSVSRGLENTMRRLQTQLMKVKKNE